MVHIWELGLKRVDRSGGAGGPVAGGWRSFAAAGRPARSNPGGGTIPAAVAVPCK